MITPDQERQFPSAEYAEHAAHHTKHCIDPAGRIVLIMKQVIGFQ